MGEGSGIVVFFLCFCPWNLFIRCHVVEIASSVRWTLTRQVLSGLGLTEDVRTVHTEGQRSLDNCSTTRFYHLPLSAMIRPLYSTQPFIDLFMSAVVGLNTQILQRCHTRTPATIKAKDIYPNIEQCSSLSVLWDIAYDAGFCRLHRLFLALSTRTRTCAAIWDCHCDERGWHLKGSREKPEMSHFAKIRIFAEL